MRLSKLRIGNIVWDNYSGEMIISAINPHEGMDKLEEGVYLRKNSNLPSGYYSLNHIKPIRLSEEWLLRFGFKKNDSKDYWIDLQTHYLELIQSPHYWYPIYVEVPEMSCDEEQRVSLNRIQYVHELQNLFFALTNQELLTKN